MTTQQVRAQLAQQAVDQLLVKQRTANLETAEERELVERDEARKAAVWKARMEVEERRKREREEAAAKDFGGPSLGD
jgi:hypothetical protein